MALKVGQTDLVVGLRSGFVSRFVHVCKITLCASVTIYATLVNTDKLQGRTDTQHFDQLM